MKKFSSIVLSIVLIMAQLILVLPTAVSGTTDPDLVAKYTKNAYNAGTKGYTLKSVAVGDNEFFTSALEFTVEDGELFNSTTTRDPAIYVGDNAVASIEEWAKNSQAQMRFFVKTPHSFQVTLRLQHSYNGSYNNATCSLNVGNSDKWQEIRISRSDFSTSADFDTAVKGAGSVNFQFLVPQNTFMDDETVVISPIEFYDGEIKTEIDPDGGTIDSTPKEGTKIAEFDSIGYRAATKPYTTAVETVANNKNFNSSVSLKIDDFDAYSNAGGDAAMYSEDTADANIGEWAKVSYAELRFWILVPHEVTFTLRLQHYHSSTGYNNATYQITVPSSEKWQEIRVKRSDFEASGEFNNAVGGQGRVYLQILTAKNAADFMAQDEKLFLSPISFYNGFINEDIDPTGGTVDLTPTVGTEIGKYDKIGWNADGKGYSVTEEAVADNKNFNNAVALTVTDEETYNNRGGDAAVYSANVSELNISNWADKPFAQLRFWIKVPHQLTFTLRLIHSSGSVYTKVISKVNVPDGDKWQEIRIAREDFSGDSNFNDVIGTDGSVNVQILTDKDATDFLKQDEELLMSPVSFYDGFIEEEIDQTGGTITVTPEKGKEIAKYKTKAYNKDGKGYSVSENAVADNKNFASAVSLKITDYEIYSSNGGDAALYAENVKDCNINEWADRPYAELRFWVKVPRNVTFTLRLIHSADGVYTKVIHKLNIAKSDKWQEIRIARKDFSGDGNFNNIISQDGSVNIQILTDKGATDFLKQGEELLMSPVSFYDGYIEEAIDEEGGTIIVKPVKGKKIATYDSKGYYADGKGYTVTEKAVADNKNFKNSVALKITDEETYSNRGGDAALYAENVKECNIKEWAEKPYAELRFWIKVPRNVTFTLRLIHSADGVYTKITHKLNIAKSDKWQEIRIAREDFSGDINFNNVVGTNGMVNIQILTDKGASDFLKQGEELLMSPVGFYNGYIDGEIDKNGGTVVIKPVKGKEIAKYSSVGYNALGKGYSVTEKVVADNRNFTSAVALKIIDEKIYSSRGGDAALYAAKADQLNIKNWANKPYAQMRFWIKTPRKVTFTLRLIHSANGKYTKIAYKITVPKSDKWQEIRIDRDLFTGDGTFNNVVGKAGSLNIQILTDKGATDFLKQGEELLISPVSFYNGYINGKIDKNGGTLVIKPTKGKKIATYSISSWNSTDKGYSVSDIAVADNKNFKIGRKLTVTNEKLYLSQNRDPAIFMGNNTDQSIVKWVSKTYNEMRFWVKVPRKVTFTIRLMNNSDGVYTGITKEITVKASKNWQEIRIAREDFEGSIDFNKAVAKKGNVHLQILTSKSTKTFIKQDEFISISPIEFYNGYIPEKIDATGGTVKIPTIYGKKINSVPAKMVKSLEGTRLQMISVYDNDFVSQALKVTVTDEDVFYDNKTQINTNGLLEPTNLYDWYDYQKAEIRFWVKVPHKMKLKLQIVERIDTQYPYIETTVDIPEKSGWQQIKISRSEFNSNFDFTGKNIQYIRILPADYENREDYLGFCESLVISQIEFFDGIIPKSANKVNKGKSGKLIETFNLLPYVGNGTLPEIIEVKDNSNFKTAVATKIGDVRTFSTGEGSHVIHNDEVTDISVWHKNPNAQLRFFVRSAKDLVLEFGLQNPGSEDASSYRAIWAQISISGSDNWQEVRLSSKHFGQTVGFDPSRVKYIKIKGTGDETVTTNEIFYISNIEVYDGTVSKAVSANGGTTKPFSENAIISTFSAFDVKSEKELDVKEIEVNNNKHFTTAYEFKALKTAKINTVLKTYYDTYNISRGKNGTLRLWVKPTKSGNFNIVFTDKSGKEISFPFKVKASDSNWQELRVDIKDLRTNGFDFTKLFTVSLKANLSKGDVLCIAKAELWKNLLETEIDPMGGEVEPPLVLPPVWETLPTMGADEENRVLINTSNSDFWTGDWNDTSRPRSFAANNRGLDKKDINYSRFKIYKELAVLDSSVYYKNPTPAMFYFRKTTDITPYLKTGTLRFWVNVPKDMALKITLQSVDEENKYSTATVVINVKKVTENNGFSEVQIPLKDFYDSAVKDNIMWNPYFVKHILVGGIDGCTENTFIKEGELLNVSHFEIWKADALEPEPFDPTRIFYSLHGEIFLKDIDDVLSKTAMLSAYRDTLNEENYKKIVEKYYDGGNFAEAYTVQLISAGQYDYNIVTAYDDVIVYIPLTEGLDTNNLSVAVYNREGLFDCEFKVENEYLAITTKQFGEFVLVSGGKRNQTKFNYNEDMSRIFGLAEFGETGTVSREKSFPWVALIIVSASVLLLAAGSVAVIIIIKKKGINRKEKV